MVQSILPHQPEPYIILHVLFLLLFDSKKCCTVLAGMQACITTTAVCAFALLMLGCDGRTVWILLAVKVPLALSATLYWGLLV